MNLLEKLSGKSINFLIGAGASAGVYPTLYLHDDYSLEDVLSHENLTEEAREFLLVLYFIHWIYPMYEEAAADDEKQRLKKVEKDYKVFLTNLINFMIREPKTSANRINIFTTNYDLMFERAFDQVVQEFPLVFFNDGSSGFIEKTISNENYYIKASHVGYRNYYTREIPNINLFKPHGSISWRLEGEETSVIENSNEQNGDDTKDKSEKKEVLKTRIKVDYNLEQIKKGFDEEYKNVLDRVISNKEDNEAWKALGNPNSNILKLEQYVNEVNQWGEKWLEISDDVRNKLKTWLKTNVPVINPHKWKFHETVMDEYYYQQLRSLSYELEQENSVLIVFGFSFADEHIRNIIKRSLYNPNLQVFIIAYSENSYKAIKKYFRNYKNVSFLPLKEKLKHTQGNFDYLNNLLKSKKLSDNNA